MRHIGQITEIQTETKAVMSVSVDQGHQLVVGKSMKCLMKII